VLLFQELTQAKTTCRLFRLVPGAGNAAIHSSRGILVPPDHAVKTSELPQRAFEGFLGSRNASHEIRLDLLGGDGPAIGEDERGGGRRIFRRADG
jgi:hypothetical protein